MLFLVVAAVVAFLWLGGPKMLPRFNLGDTRSLLSGGMALAGLVIAGLLILTGRGTVALAALTLFGPAIWQAVRRVTPASNAPGAQAAKPDGMSRDEALEVLGLRAGASATDIRAAHLRLMRGAHPDAGGSDWLAARVNRARDVLLAA